MLCLFASCAASATPEPDVFVIGSLHELHASEPAFPYETLRQLLLRIEPEVLVLEVRPDELEQRSTTPGRPEYPAVLWPLLKGTHIVAIAMEPGGDDFRRISSAARASVERATAQDPASAKSLDSLDRSLEVALQAHWVDAADSQDAVTAALARAVALVREQKLGEAYVAAQSEWDGFMAARAVEAVVNNPRKRIVVLGSYRNRALLTDAIRRVAPERLVDVATYMTKAQSAGGY